MLARLIGLTGIVCALLAGSATASSADDFGRIPAGQWDRDVFFYGGAFGNEDFGHAFLPWSSSYNGDYMAAVGYQQFFRQWNGFKFGGEAGLAARYSGNLSIEGWVGAVARYDGFAIGPVHISPALTAGFSAVSGYVSSEKNQLQNVGGEAPMLFYLGPEINVSFDQMPDLEFFVRIQHRSGGFGTIAKIDAANADTVGLRWKF